MGKIFICLEANKLACNRIMGISRRVLTTGTEKRIHNTEDSTNFTLKPVPFASLFPHSDEEVTSWILHMPSVGITSLGFRTKKTCLL